MAWGDFTNPDAWKSAMANLLRRGGEITDYIQQAPSKAGQAILDAGQRQQALMNEAFDPTGKTLIRNPQAANQAAMNLLEGPLGFMPAGITAWHGSPHTFEKFDMSKVGTGEGAQAYGHGMYFGEARGTGEGYQQALGRQAISANGKDLEGVQKSVADRLKDSNYEDTLAWINNNKKAFGKQTTQEYKDALEQIKGQQIQARTGNLYKVDIPDEYIPKMLKWDESVPEDIRQKLSDVAMQQFGSGLTGTSGEKLYKDLTFSFKQAGSKTPAADASKWLNEQGIPGITYLDQGSRGAKKGTSNFVVFDPTTVKILERNNQPLTRKEILEEEVNKLK